MRFVGKMFLVVVVTVGVAATAVFTLFLLNAQFS